VVFYCQ